MSAERLKNRLGELSGLLQRLASVQFGGVVIDAARDELLEVSNELYRLGFERLDMVTALDRDDSFVVVHRLESRSLSSAVMVKTEVPRHDPRVASVCDVWPAANWQEREVFDLFGIVFEGHPDLRRMFLPEDFNGHPLRRDYDDPRMIRRPDYI